jgi:hypothetical protein
MYVVIVYCFIFDAYNSTKFGRLFDKYKKRMELHICPSSAQVSGKTFETNETNTTNPILVLIFKGTVGAVPKDNQTPRKGISYLIHRFGLLVVFQTSSMKRIKRNMPILTDWLFSILTWSLQLA